MDDIKLVMDLASALLSGLERRFGPERAAEMLEQWAAVLRMKQTGKVVPPGLYRLRPPS